MDRINHAPTGWTGGAGGLSSGRVDGELQRARVGTCLVRSMLGCDVERVTCAWAASVQYSSVGSWAGNAQGYAGGFLAAGFLAGSYYLMFERSCRPLRNPTWWGAELGVVLWIGRQIVIGVLEVRSAPGEDCTALIASSPVRYLAIISLSLAAATALYTWRWRIPRRADT